MTPVESSRQPGSLRYASFAATLLLALSPSITGLAAPPPVLPHDYSLRVDYATQSYEDALLTVRNHLLAALRNAGTFPSGYPTPCRFRVDSHQESEAPSAVTPYRSEVADKGAQGILLDGEGHYLVLGVLDSPDSRPSLFDIFLIGDSEVPVPERSTRDTLPRIVIQAPVPWVTHIPAVVELLAQGLRRAGAQEIPFK